jgi:putative membrane protein
MFLWTKPLGLKTFRNSPEKATESAVLAANQGLYNGFLAAGLVWGLIQSTPAFAFQIKVFFLLCVIVAGIYGAATVSRRILLVQAAPAAIALILLWLV